MRIARLARRTSRVGVLGRGRFWCLYCEGEHGYQMRAVIPGNRVFVRCDACQATFDPRCLDESSTDTCAELMVNVPEFAYGPAEVPAWESLQPPRKEPIPEGLTLREFLALADAPPEVTSE